MKLLAKAYRDNRGVAMIMVAISLVMIFAFAVLAIDVAMILLAKTELQNAADAAALSAAIAYHLSEGDEVIATNEAIAVAGYNTAVQDTHRPVIITAADVTFPEPDRVTVTTHRTAPTGDPVALYFLKVINAASANQGQVTARATARVFAVSGTDCIKPWCFPDQWEDADYDSTYDAGEYYDPYITGYKVPDDIGVQVTLKLRNASKSPLMGWYYAVDFGPINTGDPVITGADAYREWIGGCEPYVVAEGDWLQIEPGNMVGPTQQGIANLIDLDPLAEFDPVTGTVINSAYPVSPRIIKACCFDPTIGVQTDLNGRPYLTIAKILVLFLETHTGADVTGRFIRRATSGEICEDCPDGFVFRAALVE